jgi:7-cyano-7-deazaguanine synthase
MKKKSILLYSGGIDSTVLLYLKQKEIALACYFDYGSKNAWKELDAVNNFCNKLNIPLKVISISNLFHNTISSLVNSSVEIKKNAKENMVPFRNGIFISIAASIAEEMGLKKILYGAIGDGSESDISDISYEFTEAMSLAVKEGTRNEIVVEAPLGMMGKSEVISLGKKLKISLEETYSCYAGTVVPCGKCDACVQRINAFKELSNENK